MQQTDHDRVTRQIALRYAIDNARGAGADTIVADAEQFHTFLTNTKTEGKQPK